LKIPDYGIPIGNGAIGSLYTPDDLPIQDGKKGALGYRDDRGGPSAKRGGGTFFFYLTIGFPMCNDSKKYKVYLPFSIFSLSPAGRGKKWEKRGGIDFQPPLSPLLQIISFWLPHHKTWKGGYGR
jgi:hypothetical protein